jgi:hypothetical protein
VACVADVQLPVLDSDTAAVSRASAQALFGIFEMVRRLPLDRQARKGGSKMISLPALLTSILNALTALNADSSRAATCSLMAA